MEVAYIVLNTTLWLLVLLRVANGNKTDPGHYVGLSICAIFVSWGLALLLL